MVIVANEPPYSVCIGKLVLSTEYPEKNSGRLDTGTWVLLSDCHSRPAPRGTGRIEHLKNIYPKLFCHSEAKRGISISSDAQPALPLAELEALSSALLPILLPLFAARIARDQTFRLQLAAQLRIKLHQGARNAELHSISLATHSTAQNIGDDVERSRGLCRGQRSLRRRALRRSHEILLEFAAVYLKIAAARTQINPRNRPLPPSRSVVLNQFSHLASRS